MSEITSNFMLMRIVRDARSTRGSARAVLVALALRANVKSGFISWPSIDRIAVDCQLDPATVKRALKRLVKQGLISISPRPNKSHRFYINVKLLLEQADHVAQAEAVATAMDDQAEPVFAVRASAATPTTSSSSPLKANKGGIR